MKCTVCGLTAEVFEGQICPNCGAPVGPSGGEDAGRSAAGLFRRRKQPSAQPAAPDSSPPFAPPPLPRQPDDPDKPAAGKKGLPRLLVVEILVAAALVILLAVVVVSKAGLDDLAGPGQRDSAPAAVSEGTPFSSSKGLATGGLSAVPTEAPPAVEAAAQAGEAVPDSAPLDAAPVITLPGGSTAPESDFFFPRSGTEALRYEMLDAAFGGLERSLQLQCSQLAINEIYARYGYNFHPEKSDTARQAYDYFNSLDWYIQISAGTSWSNTGEVPVNATEAANIELLVRWQKDHGLR